MRRSAGERMSVVSTRQEIAAMRWEPGRAWSYMEKFGTIVGCNFVPSYCYNYIQLWYDFREPIIARELDWAKECGVNSLRMFLPLFSFQRGGGWESVKKNVDRFYEMASERGFSIMQTFQPNYFRHEKGEEEGTFHVEFHPGCHRNHWQHANSDFSPLSTHPEMMQDLFGMMQDFMTEHKEEARIIAWDLWNETWAEDAALLEQEFAYARTLGCSQPLTACWQGFDLSDIITFHNYTQPGKEPTYALMGSLDFLSELERALSYGRPVLCTECLARTFGNTFESILPYFSENSIGFYFWGLCAGSAQYHYPWDWPEGAPEPRNWFHCILYPDGEPYRPQEILLLKNFRCRKWDN